MREDVALMEAHEGFLLRTYMAHVHVAETVRDELRDAVEISLRIRPTNDLLLDRLGRHHRPSSRSRPLDWPWLHPHLRANARAYAQYAGR